MSLGGERSCLFQTRIFQFCRINPKPLEHVREFRLGAKLIGLRNVRRSRPNDILQLRQLGTIPFDPTCARRQTLDRQKHSRHWRGFHAKPSVRKEHFHVLQVEALDPLGVIRPQRRFSR